MVPESTFLNETETLLDVITHPPSQSNFFKKIKNFFRLSSLIKNSAGDEAGNNWQPNKK